jgi:hypothetical protein
MIAGTKIDNACPNHPRCARTRHPAPAHRGPPPSRGRGATRHMTGRKRVRRPPPAKSGSQIKSGAPRRARRSSVRAPLLAGERLCRQPMTVKFHHHGSNHALTSVPRCHADSSTHMITGLSRVIRPRSR